MHATISIFYDAVAAQGGCRSFHSVMYHCRPPLALPCRNVDESEQQRAIVWTLPWCLSGCCRPAERRLRAISSQPPVIREHRFIANGRAIMRPGRPAFSLSRAGRGLSMDKGPGRRRPGPAAAAGPRPPPRQRRRRRRAALAGRRRRPGGGGAAPGPAGGGRRGFP
jgi:hypothetical protein